MSPLLVMMCDALDIELCGLTEMIVIIISLDRLDPFSPSSLCPGAMPDRTPSMSLSVNMGQWSVP